ncbi:MAG: divalent-cation tolerance protein CutA [Sandaracinaceae bacterium]|nr:divalent-cation tolerance protein CutA [Sandaracinaceae bacterium]
MNPEIVLSTTPNPEVAVKLAEGIVRERLAACVNIVPQVRSIYFWEGEIQRDEECLLIIKSRSERRDALFAYLAEHHPYDVPEVIALPISAGSASYLRFIESNTLE